MKDPFDILTPEQRETVEHYQAFNVPADWFVGTPESNGTVEVIAMGRGSEPAFIWSLIIERDGEVATQEAVVGDFSTGIEI